MWVFPNASDLLNGFGPHDADVTLQATTESELTRAVRRLDSRPVVVREPSGPTGRTLGRR